MSEHHIVQAFFTPEGRYKTRSVYQYDYGQELRLVGFPEGMVPSVFEVHFTGALATQEAVTMIGTNLQVQIPDVCLRKSTTIYAWLFLHDTQTDGETRYEIQIPIKARPGVSNAKPTPQQQDVISETIAALTGMAKNRIHSLNDVPLSFGNVVEVAGIPVYVDNVANYPGYGITETGWYVFARIDAKDGTAVTAETTITGADGYIAIIGNRYVDVAVRFEVAALSRTVVIDWGAYTDEFVFRATDLAVRNLDYRVTFYVYDIAPYVTWEYALTTDTVFAAGKQYYTKDENDVYTLAQVETVAYVLTEDTVFQSGKTYYISDGEGGYTAATVQTVAYVLTEDETFQDGKTYYTTDGTTYTAATVTTGEAVTAETYYEATTVPVTANTYYEQTTVPIPADTYYNHSSVTFSGMKRNITYQCNEIIDCPQVYVLPEIEDDEHGCWFEIRLRHSGSFSSTLQVPEGVKVATEHTQAETAGLNMVDLHYSNVGGVKLWRFLNTHSTIPA